MTTTSPSHGAPQIPAPALHQSAEFQAALSKFLAKHVENSLSDMVAPENKLRLHHGRSWGGGGQDTGSSEGTFKMTSAETMVPFESVLRNDMTALPHYIATLAETIVGEMKRNVYATVSAASERVGNVVSVKDAGSPAQAFLQMLQTIEFGVNSKGEVSLPAMHLSPEMHKKMLDDLSAQGPEFQAEVERIKKEKTAEALRREQERLDKYRK
jgi:hypothetical protein